MAIVHVTKENFDQVVTNSGKKVLLDFWATWCGPCKMIAPLLEEIDAGQNQVVIGKVNVDEEMELAMKFHVTSIPTLALIKDGKIVATSVGFRPKEDILRFMDQG